MLRLPALGLWSQSRNTSIKLFFFKKKFSCCHGSLCSFPSAGFWGIGFLFFLSPNPCSSWLMGGCGWILGSLSGPWLPLTHGREGKYNFTKFLRSSPFPLLSSVRFWCIWGDSCCTQDEFRTLSFDRLVGLNWYVVHSAPPSYVWIQCPVPT